MFSFNDITIFSVLNEECVALNLVFLKNNMIFILTLEQSDRLSDLKNPNFAKPRLYLTTARFRGMGI